MAQAIPFLATDEARFVNDVHLAVDGGVEDIALRTCAAFLPKD